MATASWNQVQREFADNIKTKNADDIKKKIVIPNPVPAGNRLAHFIRSIHWNSKGMLPSTAGSRRTYDKYNSVTQLSFQGPEGFKILPGQAEGGFERKRETIADVMLDPKKKQMFNRWKVPPRLISSAREPVKPPTPMSPLGEPDDDCYSEPGVCVHTPSIAPERKVESKPVSRMSREMSLPNIHIKPQSFSVKSERLVSRNESRNGLQQTLPPRSPVRALGSSRQPDMVHRANTFCGDTRRKPMEVDRNGVPMNFALRPEAVPQAEEWMKHADKADKQVIQRILKMASKKNQLENSLKKTLLPDAKDTVEKWMKGANDDERQVALSFFNSLAGGQLMGMTVENQRKRLKEVISTLEDAKPGVLNGGPKRRKNPRKKERISDGNLQYIRLLTPDTRENRWMHTTWHHLPNYKDDDPVANWSSHYIRPHEPIPRHYVIHPDWG